jgi:beta-carotene 3-hydroxylase
VTIVLRNAVLATTAFVAMEPVAYAAHRWVMHGPGWGLHRSHHRRPPATSLAATALAATALDSGAVVTSSWRERIEANDAFPVAFAGVTVVAMAAGTRSRRLAALVPVAAGVTAYGAAYSAVHDLYIHRRLGGWLGRLERSKAGAALARAHVVHHRGGGEPYGMLLPLRWRERELELANTNKSNESTAGGRGNA